MNERIDTIPPVDAGHLRMRLTGLAKGVDHLEPGEREFCLAAIGETLDYVESQRARLATALADGEMLKERLERVSAAGHALIEQIEVEIGPCDGSENSTLWPSANRMRMVLGRPTTWEGGAEWTHGEGASALRSP